MNLTQEDFSEFLKVMPEGKGIFMSKLPDGNLIDFCDRCGKGVWGEKMFNTIVQNMFEAKQRGDLNQGGS